MDGIMLFEKGKITPFLAFTSEYTLNMNDFKKLDGDLNNFKHEMIDQLKNFGKVFDINSYFEHKDLIFMEFWLGQSYKTLLYNQKTKESKYISLFDDMIYKKKDSNFSQDPPAFIGYDDNGLIAVKDAIGVKEILDKNLASAGFKSAASELSDLERDANPVLLYYEFK